jgi:biopolymer transport protein ExbD
MPAARRHLHTAETNVIPLVDVVMVILTFLMITAPTFFSHTEKQIVVPVTREAEVWTEDKVTVGVTQTGVVTINDSTTNVESITPWVAKALSKNPGMLIVIRADKMTEHGKVLEVLSAVKNAGATRIAISTKRQKEA